MLPHRRRSVASADWCHDRRLFGSHTALAGNLAEVTWGRRCWSGLVVGKWGRGGSRLVDSEKSLIVTLSAVCGAGWTDRERTFATRTALFSHRTRGWDLSHLQEIAALAGYRSPRCAAGAHCPDAVGAVRCLAVGGCTPRESRCVRVAGPCCRSLPAPGMDCGQAGLSQSDSRLGDVELTEFDSTTILSAYDST